MTKVVNNIKNVAVETSIVTNKNLIKNSVQLQKYVPLNNTEIVKPNDLKNGLSGKIQDLVNAYKKTKLANMSFVRSSSQSACSSKYNNKFLKDFVDNEFEETNPLLENELLSQEKKLELVRESKDKILLFLTEYRDACYSSDVERVQKLTAMFFSKYYSNNTDFRGQCLQLMENITNNSNLNSIVNPRDFSLGVLSSLNNDFDFSKLDKLFTDVKTTVPGGSLFKVSNEMIVAAVLAIKNPDKTYYITNDQDLNLVLESLNLKNYRLLGDVPQKKSDLLEVDHENQTYCVREIKTTYTQKNLDLYRNKIYNLGCIKERAAIIYRESWENRLRDSITQKLLDEDISEEKKENLLKVLSDLNEKKITAYDVSKYYIDCYSVVDSFDFD